MKRIEIPLIDLDKRLENDHRMAYLGTPNSWTASRWDMISYNNLTILSILFSIPILALSKDRYEA